MEKQTVFIKRYPSKGEFPEYCQRVIGLVLEQNDLGLSKFLWNVSYNDDTKTFKMNGGVSVNIEFWLEEIELPNEEDMEDHLLNHRVESRVSVKRGMNFILNKLKGEIK